MAEYEDLSNIIGKMKLAAIDCWMADQGFYLNWGNDQLYSKWGFMLNFYNRPDAQGDGGGTGNGVNHSVAPQFEEIRAAIDGIVSRWLDLPDGEACETPRQQLTSTAARLGTSGASASVENSGEIATSNNTLHEVVVNKLSGGFVAPFLDKYYTQFSKVTPGLGDACVILETNYIAESKMWPAARKDAADICEAAQMAFQQQADRAAAANGTLVLTVVAAVAGVVASVVTAGAGTVAAVAALGGVAAAANTTIQKIRGNAEVSGSSYHSILDSLGDALEKLHTVLEEQETALDKMMQDAITAISDDLESYNLDAFSLGNYPATVETISMDASDASIVSTNMGRIEAALVSASTKLGSAPATNPTPRQAGVGLGSSGTHPSASELFSLTAQCLSQTASEYATGLELFDATVEDYFETESEVSKTIAEILAHEALSEGVTT